VGNVASKLFTADSETSPEFIYNAIAESDVHISQTDYVDNFISGVDASSFVSPTSQAGVVSSEEIDDSDFSLTASSPAVNAGVWDYQGDYKDYPATFVGYVDGNSVHQAAIDAYAKDLAGNPRRTSDGKISLGCYQEAKASGIASVGIDASQVVVSGLTGGISVVTVKAATVEVYTIAGALASRTAVSAGESFISLPAGVYVVRVAGSTLKAVVR
jgi:hypothetical protein